MFGGLGRETAADAPDGRRRASRPRRCGGDGGAGDADPDQVRRAEGLAGLHETLSDRWRIATRGHEADPAAARRDPGASRPRRARRFLSRRTGARHRADLAAVGSPVSAEDLAAHRATRATPLSTDISAGTLYNMTPPTQGLASLMILGPVRPAGRRAGRELRPYPRPRRGDQARLPGARPLRHRPGLHDPRPGRIPRPALPGCRGGEDRPRQRAALAAAGAPGDTVWLGAIDGEGRAVSFIQSTYWEFGSGVVLPRDRVPVAEPRHQLLAGPRRANR